MGPPQGRQGRRRRRGLESETWEPDAAASTRTPRASAVTPACASTCKAPPSARAGTGAQNSPAMIPATASLIALPTLVPHPSPALPTLGPWSQRCRAHRSRPTVEPPHWIESDFAGHVRRRAPVRAGATEPTGPEGPAVGTRIHTTSRSRRGRRARWKVGLLAPGSIDPPCLPSPLSSRSPPLQEKSL